MRRELRKRQERQERQERLETLERLERQGPLERLEGQPAVLGRVMCRALRREGPAPDVGAGPSSFVREE
jgi:hypothetical protein